MKMPLRLNFFTIIYIYYPTTINLLNTCSSRGVMDDRNKQLHRDMDSYLSRRKRDSWSGHVGQPVLHPIVHPYKKEEPMEQAKSPMEQEYEKKGWFSGFMNKLFGEDTETTETVSTVTTTDTSTDLKELARISISVMKKMPGDLVREFKESPDYEAFKSILRKHNLGK